VTHSNDGKDEKGALRSDQNKLMFGQGFSFSGYERDPLYLNLGTKKFMDVSGVSGIDSITDGRGGVFADFDNDGDQDVFSTTIQNQSHLLFRNNVGQENNFLRVELEGNGKDVSRDAFGAVVRVHTTAGTLTKIKSGGSGFISQNDPRLLFGLGRDARAESVEVTWPNGKVERFEGDFAAGTTVRLRKDASRAENVVLAKAKLPEPLTKADTLAQTLKISVGKPLPAIIVRTLEGRPSRIRGHLKPGRQTLINVWATWCLPCAKEMPELERLLPKLAARGIDVVGLNVDTLATAPVGKYVSEKKVTYPILLGGIRAVGTLYATEELTVPLSILVNEKGVVTDLIPGWSAATQRRFSQMAGAVGAASQSRNDR
jgi:thiol-disulfide isomerase/thioredoxin